MAYAPLKPPKVGARPKQDKSPARFNKNDTYRQTPKESAIGLAPRLGRDVLQPFLQAKLIVGAPGDSFEREADHIAEKVVSRMQHTSSGTSDTSPVNLAHGAPSTDHEDVVRRECDACPRENEEPLAVRRKATSTAVAATSSALVPPSGFGAQLGSARTQGGRALDASLRTPLEQQFGADLSRVRIRDDTRAAALTSQIGARAFTIGNDVFFNRGEFRPRMRDGQKLIAHELAHCLQQDTAYTVRRSRDSSRTRMTDVEPKSSGKTRAASLLAAVGSGAHILSVFFDIHQDSPSEQVLIEMSIAFVEGLSDDNVAELLATPEGRTVVRVILRYASMGAYKATGPILLVYDRAKIENVKDITSKNFPDNDSECMNRFLFSVRAVLGDERLNVYDAMLPQARKLAKIDADAKRSGKKAKVKMRMVHYMHPLIDLGHARYLGRAYSQRTRCIAALVFGGADAERKDPFTLRDQNVALYEPNPEDMMLEAVSGSPKGAYVFLASVQRHHTVTFILTKYKDGPVKKGAGSGSYRLFWNDQYTDGPRSKGGKNQLGEEITGPDLVERFFRLTETIRSDPESSLFGSPSSSPPSTLRNQRCTNNRDVLLWQMLPGPLGNQPVPKLTDIMPLGRQGDEPLP